MKGWKQLLCPTTIFDGPLPNDASTHLARPRARG